MTPSLKSPVSRMHDAHNLAIDGLHKKAIVEYDKAIADFTWAVRGHPEYMAGKSWGLRHNFGYEYFGLAYAWKAQSLCVMGMCDEALEACNLAMGYLQDDARIGYATITTLGMCGLHKEAMDLVAGCISHNPHITGFYYVGVLVLLAAKRNSEAEQLAAEAISLDPDDEYALASRAMVLWDAGDTAGALDALDRSISHSTYLPKEALRGIRYEIGKKCRPAYAQIAVAGMR